MAAGSRKTWIEWTIVVSCVYRKKGKINLAFYPLSLCDNLKENKETEREREREMVRGETPGKRRLDIDFETALKVFPPTMFRVAHSDNAFVSVAMLERGVESDGARAT